MFLMEQNDRASWKNIDALASLIGMKLPESTERVSVILDIMDIEKKGTSTSRYDEQGDEQVLSTGQPVEHPLESC
jgi:lipopolysaccharide export system protein LptC